MTDGLEFMPDHMKTFNAFLKSYFTEECSQRVSCYMAKLLLELPNSHIVSLSFDFFN